MDLEDRTRVRAQTGIMLGNFTHTVTSTHGTAVHMLQADRFGEAMQVYARILLLLLLLLAPSFEFRTTVTLFCMSDGHVTVNSPKGEGWRPGGASSRGLHGLPHEEQDETTCQAAHIRQAGGSWCTSRFGPLGGLAYPCRRISHLVDSVSPRVDVRSFGEEASHLMRDEIKDCGGRRLAAPVSWAARMPCTWPRGCAGAGESNSTTKLLGR